MPYIEALTKSREEKGAGLTTGASDKRKTGGQVEASDMTPKRMKDSYYRSILSLGQDPWLLDEYINATGQIRLGSLLMDLDALAGVVSYRHAGDDVALVTAAVDRITIENPLKEICDLELSGQVTYSTGRSSMEISLQVAKAPVEGEAVKAEDVLITCAFTMVALDPKTRKPASVAPLLVETAEERRLFENGERNYNAKKDLRKRSLKVQTPNDEESDLIHAMWTKRAGRAVPPELSGVSATNMKDTMLSSAQIMQPYDRNRHNFMIFGGYLLKQTFELAYCCAASFSRSRPTFLCLEPSTFDNPVPVGCVSYLNAVVSYTQDSPSTSTSGQKFTRVQVRVDTTARNIDYGTTNPTGTFNYTFLVEGQHEVWPQTYDEFMIWVEARRNVENMNDRLSSPDNVASTYKEGAIE
ncbi:hypothetical protein McanMca71_001559 [Microsporum canis]|uniref:Acyl-coenzyme A thioesterase 9 n=1 Tax=Arthroderma otae (strain ATCC MYA-4605 / CBS 113480) TaxID=554155 RepID=C5FEK5_ARTOC|nr:acyl-coenzyme A thioesterase 9 [Microsporum canis CBS 113480]EEQ28329.1 acyl-coenzyme A thioesterase 9 [Microsporum canis CBS 113480]